MSKKLIKTDDSIKTWRVSKFFIAIYNYFKALVMSGEVFFCLVLVLSDKQIFLLGAREEEQFSAEALLLDNKFQSQSRQ